MRDNAVDGRVLFECIKADVMKDGASEAHVVLLTASALLSDIKNWSDEMIDELGGDAIEMVEQRRASARAKTEGERRADREQGSAAAPTGFSSQLAIPAYTHFVLGDALPPVRDSSL
jgi:hypothetical protein